MNQQDEEVDGVEIRPCTVKSCMKVKIYIYKLQKYAAMRVQTILLFVVFISSIDQLLGEPTRID